MNIRKKCNIHLATPAHEMAQEEIQKQVAFLGRDVTNLRFLDRGRILEFETDGLQDDVSQQVTNLAQRVQKSLRTLQRKIVFKSSAADNPKFRGDGGSVVSGVCELGPGQVALHGLSYRLFRYFDRVFEAFGLPWQPIPVLTPTLIPSRVLAKCDYFRSFPNNVTFACHLNESVEAIDEFRARHQNLDELDEKTLDNLAPPTACLSPAVCYHVYHMNHDQAVVRGGATYGICGKCFRYESSNMSGLRRLWDFTMREIVFLGSRDHVLRCREQSMELMGRFVEEHKLAGEIRTASDPFFSGPDALAKAYFQLSSETKYEVSLMLPGDGRLAVGSHNYHTDFFGRAFNVTLEEGGLMHSVCVGFGLERWVHAFVAQHGVDPGYWPDVVRESPEFAGG